MQTTQSAPMGSVFPAQVMACKAIQSAKHEPISVGTIVVSVWTEVVKNAAAPETVPPIGRSVLVKRAAHVVNMQSVLPVSAASKMHCERTLPLSSELA